MQATCQDITGLFKFLMENMPGRHDFVGPSLRKTRASAGSLPEYKMKPFPDPFVSAASHVQHS